jgi:uncharacterized protein (DUF305 family)
MTAIDTDGSEHLDANGAFDEEVEDRPRFEWTWPKVLLLVGAVAFLAAAATYFLTSRAEEDPGTVDVGFLQDMIDHHDQAVGMALNVIGRDSDTTTQSFAREVVIYQRWETGVMDTLLAGWGEDRGAIDRLAMGWMGMPSPVGAMPGMQSAETIEQLGELTGSDLDEAFFTAMRAHHLGAVHMASYAAEHAETAEVRELATRMAQYQQIEANEYTEALKRLGLES